MKVFCYCVIAVLVTIANGAADVEKTVQQVQSILKNNSLLPRLTRDEIIELLNDIKAEDAKSASSSKEKNIEVTVIANYKNIDDNEIVPVTQVHNFKESDNMNKEDSVESTSIIGDTVETTTKPNGPTLTVVLPYTPRDGSSLQELYTRPPRLEIVQEKVTAKPERTIKSSKNIQDVLTANSKLASQEKIDFPAELQAFLDAHGLKSNSGKDHFLLPLDGFKPLPPGKIVDGKVQLPENILLTYDLISPVEDAAPVNEKGLPYSHNNFLYEPLQPEYPFELEASSSESKHTVLPLDLPKPKKSQPVNYEPIDYDSIKVIPLGQGPIPSNDGVLQQNEQNKRQANIAEIKTNETTSVTITTIANDGIDSKNATTTTTTSTPDSVPADSDSGASITDLEDSFGGAAPVQPGDSVLPPPKKNGFYWMVDWNSFLEVGDGDSKVNIRFEPKLGDPQMFLPVNVP